MGFGTELELRPEQPEPVAEVLAALLQPPERGADPWWQAGIDEILER